MPWGGIPAFILPLSDAVCDIRPPPLPHATPRGEQRYATPTQNTATADAPQPPGIALVKDFLADPTLAIPEYQRPYKWTTRHIAQMLSDIVAHHQKPPAYRLGTVVLHQDGSQKNIVDGQQRTLSLMLTVKALLEAGDKPLRKDLRDELARLSKAIASNAGQFTFRSRISAANLRANYQEARRMVQRPEFTDEVIHFLLHRCEVVTVVLTDISEAFQFFDSQNARGRDLEPHDLLKAYHLREFPPHEKERQQEAVAAWEHTTTEELTTLFGHYLFRIRNWSRGTSARHFTKKDAALFKGVNLDTAEDHPHMRQMQMAHRFVDHYNGQFERKVDRQVMPFPFQLDQTIPNGRRFFEMVTHYQREVSRIRDRRHSGTQPEWAGSPGSLSARILQTLNSYEGRHRPGDRYVREMFDCLLIYYVDKFGHVELSRAIEKIFIWAYTLRLKQASVGVSSMDNHVLHGQNFFALLRDAASPADFLGHAMPRLAKTESTKTDDIKKLFIEMRYHA